MRQSLSSHARTPHPAKKGAAGTLSDTAGPRQYEIIIYVASHVCETLAPIMREHAKEESAKNNI
jgi:hypothetical protein